MGFKARLVAGAAAVAVSLAGLSFLQTEEGVVYTAYPDPVLGWKVPTICSGHTKGIKRGDTATDAQCLQYLKEDTDEATQAVLRCTRVPLAQHELDALNSFTLNLGGGAYCGSTLARKLNAGDRPGASREFPRWRFAGGLDCAIRSNNCYGVYIRRLHEQGLFTYGYTR